jgi:Phosphohistidine phosphatase SixA
MNMIVLVRHGCYDHETGNLMREDAKKARALGELLAKANISASPAIMTSPAKRTVQTANEIGKAFALKRAIQQFDGLNYSKTDLRPLIELIERHSVTGEDLIMVTHAPLIAPLVAYFAREYGSAEGPMPKMVEPGQAILVDTRAQYGQIISVPD